MANVVEEFVLKKTKALGNNVAATLLSTLFPKDFEAYMIALELCDGEGKTIDYMTFPIMPDEISSDENMPVTIKSTFGGVVSVSSNIFTPKQISLNGSFGRNIKVVSRNKNAVSLLKDTISVGIKKQFERTYGVDSVIYKEPELSPTFKTGYGCCKLLQSIINRSYDTDSKGRTNKLYFYNMALGESYVVKAVNFRMNQNMSTNAIWNYSLQLQAVCPVYLDNDEKFKVSLGSSVTSSINALVNSLR